MTPRPFPRSGPARRVLWGLALLVLLAHALLWWASGSPLQWRLSRAEPAAPMQLRVLTPAPIAAEAVRPRPPARAAPSRPARATPPEPTPPEAVSAEAALPPASEASTALADASLAEAAPASPVAEAPAAAPAPAEPAPSAVAAATELSAWPLIPLGALPPSTLLSYSLSGMDKGLNYHASGELRWQHNEAAYELTLSVRAFLLGSRHWRSVGRIEATGLAPQRFSDSWRQERAAHFDREGQRIVFSSNGQPAALQPGAQDQVSLYLQLAAAMAGEPERFAPGTRLQVQTATVRDAQPWALTLEGRETLSLAGRNVPVAKWVCQPRNRYEARVEFWVAAEQAWLPVRIRITQTSGSYIDLHWRGSEPLAPLPVRP